MNQTRLFLLLLLFILAGGGLLFAQSGEKKSVLILHSYHQGYEWGDSVAKGIMENLSGKENLALHIEYLDSLRNPSEADAATFETYLWKKYFEKNVQFSLVLCSDDPALQFVYARQSLFIDTPVVFCGINNFKPEQIKGMKNVTGVNEVISVEATLQTALRLRPNSRKIGVISGAGMTEQKNKEIFREKVKKTALHTEVLYLDRLEPDDLRKELAHFSKEDIVFYVSYLSTPSGKKFTVEESVRFVKSATDAAVFGFWDFLLPLHVLGGHVVHGYSQGQRAAQLANQILAGVPVSKIPIVMQSPNKYIFNGKELARFGIRKTNLPAYSIIVDRQISDVIQEYHSGKLQNFFTHEFFDNHGTIMMLIDPTDGTILDANKAAYYFYGYPNLNEMKIQEINTLTSDEIQREMHRAKVQFRNYFNFRHRLNDGSIRDVETYSYPVTIAGTEVLFSIIHDVTERVKSEKLAQTRNVIIMIGSLFAVMIFAVFSFVLYKGSRKRKRNEEMLQKSEERYRTLFETSREGIIVADAENGNFVQVNSAICKLLGYSSEEMLTMSTNDIHPKEKLPEIQAQFARLAQNKSHSALSVPLLCKNNTILFVDITSSFLEIEGKNYLVGFFDDISDKVAAEKQLRAKVDELEYLNALMMGREVKMISLKKEINELCKALGESPRYETGFAGNDISEKQ